MTKCDEDYQVVIVGGGPAGIATALTLTARGISNCIVEAVTNPSLKFGEALPPNAKPILRQLGIQHLVEDSRHIPYYGNKSSWGTDQLEQKEFIQDVHGHGYLLDRLYFESQLREHLQQYGGVFYAGYKAKKISRTPDGIMVAIQNGQETLNLKGIYVVDATGRKASVCRQLGVPKKVIDSQFALSVHVPILNPIPQQIWVEATENGWWYAAPRGKQGLTVMFFTLQECLPKKEDLEDFLRKQWAFSTHLSRLIPNENPTFRQVFIMPAGTSFLDMPYGDQWIAVGDAAYSYDPLSSYGITSALASGYYAGQALASSLSGKQDAMLAYRYIVENAFKAYWQELFDLYSLEKRWANSPYWINRF